MNHKCDIFSEYESLCREMKEEPQYRGTPGFTAPWRVHYQWLMTRRRNGWISFQDFKDQIMADEVARRLIE